MVEVVANALADLDEPLPTISLDPSVRRLILKVFHHPDRLDVFAAPAVRLPLEPFPEFDDHFMSFANRQVSAKEHSATTENKTIF